MALEDYTFSTMRTRLQEEFGHSSGDTVMNTKIDKRINDALTWVCRRRPSWPWMRTRFEIDTVVAGVGTIDVTVGTRVFDNPASFTPAVRKFITFEVSGSKPTTAHLVTAYSAPNATVEAQYLGTTTVGLACRQVEGMFQLPDDFIRVDGPPLIQGAYPTSTELRYQDPEKFQRNEHRQTPALLNNLRYTVVRDPLDLEERKYLRVYPYIADRRIIRLSYYRDIPKLVADGDIPIIPRSDRMVLWYAAAWFVGQLNDEQDVTMYRDQALEGIERMAQEFELVDDASEYVEDHSEPDFVLPPAGYEDFHR